MNWTRFKNRLQRNRWLPKTIRININSSNKMWRVYLRLEEMDCFWILLRLWNFNSIFRKWKWRWKSNSRRMINRREKNRRLRNFWWRNKRNKRKLIKEKKNYREKYWREKKLRNNRIWKKKDNKNNKIEFLFIINSTNEDYYYFLL